MSLKVGSLAGLLAFVTLNMNGAGIAVGDDTRRLENSDRSGFKTFLTALSSESRTAPLDCIESNLGEAPKKMKYTLSVSDEPRYRDAFFLGFESVPPTRSWSTLIAYEGEQDHVMGELQIKRKLTSTSVDVFYKHSFRGFFTDTTELQTRNGWVTELRYSKTGVTGGTTYELVCKKSVAGFES